MQRVIVNPIDAVAPGGVFRDALDVLLLLRAAHACRASGRGFVDAAARDGRERRGSEAVPARAADGLPSGLLAHRPPRAGPHAWKAPPSVLPARA